MIVIPVKTTNPNNGSTGNSRLASIIRANKRRSQRVCAKYNVLAAKGVPPLPVTVTITRVAPSSGLDPHDGLGAALKAIIDGVADALGLKNDRDARVTWVLAQRRGDPKKYFVEVCIEART